MCQQQVPARLGSFQTSPRGAKEAGSTRGTCHVRLAIVGGVPPSDRRAVRPRRDRRHLAGCRRRLRRQRPHLRWGTHLPAMNVVVYFYFPRTDDDLAPSSSKGRILPGFRSTPSASSIRPRTEPLPFRFATRRGRDRRGASSRVTHHMTSQRRTSPHRFVVVVRHSTRADPAHQST